MAEIRIEISDELKDQMSKFSINWESAVESIIRNKLSEWERIRSIVSKSKLTEKDALELGRKVNEGISKRYKEYISGK